MSKDLAIKFTTSSFGHNEGDVAQFTNHERARDYVRAGLAVEIGEVDPPAPTVYEPPVISDAVQAWRVANGFAPIVVAGEAEAPQKPAARKGR